MQPRASLRIMWTSKSGRSIRETKKLICHVEQTHECVLTRMTLTDLRVPFHLPPLLRDSRAKGTLNKVSSRGGAVTSAASFKAAGNGSYVAALSIAKNRSRRRHYSPQRDTHRTVRVELKRMCLWGVDAVVGLGNGVDIVSGSKTSNWTLDKRAFAMGRCRAM